MFLSLWTAKSHPEAYTPCASINFAELYVSDPERMVLWCALFFAVLAMHLCGIVDTKVALWMLCRFAVGEGDLITFLNIWRGWEESNRSRKWCYKNFINHRTMLRAADIRNQLQRHVRYTAYSTLHVWHIYLGSLFRLQQLCCRVVVLHLKPFAICKLSNVRAPQLLSISRLHVTLLKNSAAHVIGCNAS